MRRTLIFFIYILISIFLIGCGLFQNSYEKSIEITNAYLADEEQGFKLVYTLKPEELSISQDKITSYGIVIVKKEVSKLAEIVLDSMDTYYESTEIENNQLTFTISNIDQTDYSTPYSVRAYFKYQNENNEESIKYANTHKLVTLYDLAKLSDSDFAKEVVTYVEIKKVSTVEVNIDTVNDTVTNTSDDYQISLTKANNIFTVKVTLNNGYLFDKNVSFMLNGTLVNESEYTKTNNTIDYSFEDPTLGPSDYLTVNVTYNVNGGYWTSDIFTKSNPDKTLTATTLNDPTGLTYTIIDKTQTSFKYFYKLFIKYDINIKAYKIVALNAASQNISELTLPDYDYVLAVHYNCQDNNAGSVIKNYALTSDSLGMFILFDQDVTKYTEGNIQTMFYSKNAVTNNYQENLFDGVTLPIPYRKEFNFLGWSDGTNTYTKFPRYTLSQNIRSITYTAVWEPLNIEDFKNYMALNIPEIVDKDIYLPTSFSEYYVSWSSSNPKILSTNGVFKKPYLSADVSLTATLSTNSKTEVVKFDVNIASYKPLTTGIASSYIYREYYSVTDEFFDTLDIINCAFIHGNADGSLTGAAFLTNVSNYIIPKAHAQGDWVVMSIAPESSWSTISASATLINTFANNIVKMINQYGFDGVDIDWEFPSTSSETANFTAMMKVIYAKVKANNPNHIVSAAIAGGMWQPTHYDLNNSQQYIDYINMMTYSMVSTEGKYQNALYPSSTNDNTEFGVGRTLTSCSITESIAFYKSNYNIPYSKIIVGVAFYGVKQTRTYNSSTGTFSAWKNSGSVYYHSISANYLNNSNYSVHFDQETKVPYIIKKDGTEFISYDNPASILEKSAYVLSQKLGGIMYWENGCDTTGKLLEALKTGLKK